MILKKIKQLDEKFQNSHFMQFIIAISIFPLPVLIFLITIHIEDLFMSDSDIKQVFLNYTDVELPDTFKVIDKNIIHTRAIYGLEFEALISLKNDSFLNLKSNNNLKAKMDNKTCITPEIVIKHFQNTIKPILCGYISDNSDSTIEWTFLSNKNIFYFHSKEY